MQLTKRGAAVWIFAIATALSRPAMAESEVMELVAKGGAALSARIVSCDGTTLTVTRESDKKTFNVPLEKLEPASQENVKSWMTKGSNLTQNYEISVETGKTRKTTAQEDFDDKRVNLDPVVTILNADPRLPSREANVTVLFLGRPVSDNSACFVFKNISFDLPELKPLASQNFAVGHITSPYDTRGYAKFGARYLGYVVLIHDKEGTKLYDSASVPVALAANNNLKFRTLKEGRTYDRDLEPTAVFREN